MTSIGTGGMWTMSVPDAPWIVEAETKGYPTIEEVKCPVCGAFCETVYFSHTNYKEIIACNRCLREMDAAQWKEEQE